LNDLIVSPLHIKADLLKWLRARTAKSKSTSPGTAAGMVIVSPAGCGSTTLVQLVARDCGLQISPIDVSMRRTFADVASSAISEAKTGFNTRRKTGDRCSKGWVVVVDHADAVFEGADTESDIGSDRDRDRDRDRTNPLIQWAAMPSSRSHAPIIVVVSSSDSKAVRHLIASPGWTRLTMNPLSVGATAVVIKNASSRLFGRTPSYDDTTLLAHECTGDARQALIRLRHLDARYRSRSSEIRFHGNLFYAASFILSDGRAKQFSFAKQSLGNRPSAEQRYRAWRSNSKLITFIHSSFPKLMATQAQAQAQAQPIVMDAMARMAESFSVLDSTCGRNKTKTHTTSIQLRYVADVTGNTCRRIFSDSADVHVEYDARDFMYPDPLSLAQKHLLVRDSESNLGYWRRSSAELLEYDSYHHDTIAAHYQHLRGVDSRRLTGDQADIIREVSKLPRPSFSTLGMS
jgi:hypothetical protein